MKDRWLCADECATYFGLKALKCGKPNRRYFLEQIAAKPDFPRPLVIAGLKRWKLSEVEDWAEDYRRASRAA